MAVGPADLGELHVQESPALARATLDQLKIVRRESDDVQVAEKIQMTTQRAGVDSDLLGSVSGQTNAYLVGLPHGLQPKNASSTPCLINSSSCEPETSARAVVNSLQQTFLSVGAHMRRAARYF